MMFVWKDENKREKAEDGPFFKKKEILAEVGQIKKYLSFR